MTFLKTLAAATAALVISICGANAAQHQNNPTIKVDIPALVSPFALLEKGPVVEPMVVAQRRIRRRGGPRRVIIRDRRRGIGPGGAAAIIGLGIAGAAIAGSAARAHDPYYGPSYRPYYNDYGSPRYCRRLVSRCDWGERWACEQYRRVC